jgi:DNA polymerase III epsilon subunit-like protein
MNTLEGPLGKFIALDFEMTGTDPNRDRIIKIDAVLFKDGLPSDYLWSLCNPGLIIDKTTEDLVEIKNQELLAAPDVNEVIAEMVNFVGTLPMIFHHVPFDLPFIENACHRSGNYLNSYTMIDTLRLCRQKKLGLGNYRLATVAVHLGLTAKTASVLTGLIYLKLTSTR